MQLFNEDADKPDVATETRHLRIKTRQGHEFQLVEHSDGSFRIYAVTNLASRLVIQPESSNVVILTTTKY